MLQQPDTMVLEGRVLKSRYAQPGTVFVRIANDDHIYVFDAKLVKQWVGEIGGETKRAKRARHRGGGGGAEVHKVRDEGRGCQGGVRNEEVCVTRRGA